MTDELLPCPFCGTLPEIEEIHWGLTLYQVTCPHCQASSCPDTSLAFTKLSWNQRAPIAKEAT